jgi:predicted NodU family carbamoyl transferase
MASSQNPSMIILGLNAFHGDSAAALVRDGKLIAAAEEERFRRVKQLSMDCSWARQMSFCFSETC